MTWLTEFGPAFDPPDEIVELEGIRDVSWHNDSNPSFGVEIELGRDPWPSADLKIWVGHPDPEQRERFDEPRFYVVAYSYDNHGHALLEIAGVPDSGNGDDGVFTDDVGEAIDAFLSMLVKIQAARRAAA